MNKQEALVALLAECRQYEQRHEETRRVSPSVVHDHIIEVARDIEVLVSSGIDEGSPDVAYDLLLDALVRLAGGALYLLVDTVDVVADGPDVERWLRTGRSGAGTVVNGAMMMPSPMIVTDTRYVPVIVPKERSS